MSVRVISGAARGLLLSLPKQGEIRPTMDRVKAAIFSTLGSHVDGARILDLFAGTGALGIEALSRGARSVEFVESNSHAVAVIEANLGRTRLAGGRVVRSDVFRFLERGAREPFDLIFADPPYPTKPGEPDPGLDLAHDPRLPALLGPDGFFVLERLSGSGLTLPPFWRNTLNRCYGKTEVFYLAHA